MTCKHPGSRARGLEGKRPKCHLWRSGGCDKWRMKGTGWRGDGAPQLLREGDKSPHRWPKRSALGMALLVY